MSLTVRPAEMDAYGAVSAENGSILFFLRSGRGRLFMDDGLFRINHDGTGSERPSPLSPQVNQEDREGSWLRVDWDADSGGYLATSYYSPAEPLSMSDRIVVGLADGTSWDASDVLRGASWFQWVGAH